MKSLMPSPPTMEATPPDPGAGTSARPRSRCGRSCPRRSPRARGWRRSRRCCGTATRPCLSGVISTAPGRRSGRPGARVAPRARFSRRLAATRVELVDGIDGQAAVERLRHHRTPLELIAKPGREDDPTLRVEGVLVLPQEHDLRTTCTFQVWGESSPFHHQAPPYDTIHHSVNPLLPLATTSWHRAGGTRGGPWRSGSGEAAYRIGPRIPTNTR